MEKIIIFVTCFCFGLANIRIKNLQVPESVEFGTKNPVILDCDFDPGNDTSIEVKWILNSPNSQDEIIYQWIPERKKKGQTRKKYEKNIDVNYNVTSDENTMYRALHIFNLSLDLSGNYSCKVSGSHSEHIATKSMIIYVPPVSGLNLTIAENDSTIFCNADGIYPKPQMKLYITNQNGSDIIFEEDNEIFETDEDGHYDVSASLDFNPKALDNPFNYICELYIPGTAFSLREHKTHFIENDGIETQIEEEYSFNSLNSTNTTESSFEESQESQIEEDLEFDLNTTTTEEMNINFDENSNNVEDTVDSNAEGASSRHLSNLNLISTIMLLALLNILHL